MDKKILLLANSDAGLYNFRKELIDRLKKEYKVFISVPEGDYCDYFKNIGCTIYPISFDRHGTNPINELKIVKEYKNLLKHVKPDIVFTYTIKPNVYGGIACASMGIPYVANITGLGTSIENGGMMQKVSLFLYKKGLKKAQKVFFQNTANRDFMLERKIISGEYDLLPGSGVSLERYQLLEYPNTDIINFLYIGRVMKQKGIDQYLETAEYIRDKYPNTRFHICGGCEQNYSYRLNELQNKKVVIYHGRINDMSSMQKISSCTIHPTFYPEGMSNVLLESCASGRPIITTNRPGCREIVENEINGFIVEERNSQDLIEKVEKFLSLSWEERKNLGLAGRAKVEKEFDRKIVINKYIAEIEKVR